MKKLLPILVSILVISGCTASPKKHKQSSSLDERTSEIVTSGVAPTSEGTSATSVATSATSKPTSAPTSASKPTSSTTTTSKPTSSSTPVSPLPGGYTMFDAPTNTPIEITTTLSDPSGDSWWNNDLRYEFPTEDWSHIYGHNLTTPKFYDNDSGGLKMDQKYKGFQTPLFHHTGAKLEFNIGISQVNNASGTPDKSVPTGYFFFYDKNGNYLSNLTHTVEQETITANTKNVHFYVTGEHTVDVAYFEFRLNALTFKGSQNYNFGIGNVNVHSWERI